MIEIALTIDDLPRHGEIIHPYTYASVIDKLLETIQDEKLPAVCGFLNGLSLEEFPQDAYILDAWIKAGCYFGNHTYSHFDLRTISIQEYIADILKNEKLLERFGGNKGVKFFRYPFLLEGETEEKFFAIKSFLQSNNYKNVPVTIDFLDFLWNKPICLALKNNNTVALNELRKIYVEEAISHIDTAVNMAYRIFKKNIKHILLVHAGIATAFFLPDMIKAYQARGCQFIDLNAALSDDVYNADPILITPKAPNFLIRMAKLNNVEIIWPPVNLEKINQAVGL